MPPRTRQPAGAMYWRTAIASGVIGRMIPNDVLVASTGPRSTVNGCHAANRHREHHVDPGVCAVGTDALDVERRPLTDFR